MPIVITGLQGDFAFADVRLQHLSAELQSGWNALKYNEDDFVSNNVSWQLADEGDLIVDGSGSITIPTQPFTAIRFDTKISGTGTATIAIGDLEIDVATNGARKTGGITGHTINANLVDQNEWCTIEVIQNDETVVLLNGIELTRASDVPSLRGTSIVVTTLDATVHMRRVFIQ
jgi:hypothetical protein